MDKEQLNAIEKLDYMIDELEQIKSILRAVLESFGEDDENESPAFDLDGNFVNKSTNEEQL